MKAFSAEPSVVEVCLSSCSNLASENGGSAAACAEALGVSGIAELLVAAMGEHNDSESTLQEMGCLAVAALATGSAANVERLLGAGVEAVLAAAKPLIENERNQVYPDRALAALGK